MILQLQRLAFLTVMLALGGFNGAQADDLFTVALNLGSVIGSEQACGLTYDRDPIERFITEHVKASDMSFPSTLNMMTMNDVALFLREKRLGVEWSDDGQCRVLPVTNA